MPSIFKKFLDEVKRARVEERASKPRPKLVSMPSCKICSTGVQPGEMYCSTCRGKHNIPPQPSIVLTPVKEPAYARKPSPDEE